MGVKSLIIAPIFMDKAWWGFIGFDQCREPLGWTRIQRDALKTAANIFGAALSRQAAEKRLTFMATHDYLTRLPNRLLFEDRFHQATARASRSGEKFVVISLDLDKFKSVNDAYGHPVGDETLIEAGQRLAHALRSSDTCARIGGDEFGFLAESIHNKGDVLRVMEKLTRALTEPIVLRENIIRISASMGAALYPDHGSDLETIMKAADKALYSVKDTPVSFRIFDDGQYPLIEKP